MVASTPEQNESLKNTAELIYNQGYNHGYSNGIFTGILGTVLVGVVTALVIKEHQSSNLRFLRN